MSFSSVFLQRKNGLKDMIRNVRLQMPPTPKEKMCTPRQKDTILDIVPFKPPQIPKTPKKVSKKAKAKKTGIQKLNSYDLAVYEEKEEVVNDFFSRGFVTCPLEGKIPPVPHKNRSDSDMKTHTLWSGNNIGLLTGKRSNLTVIDLDTPRGERGEDGIQNFKNIVSLAEGVPSLPDNDQWAKSLGVPVVKTPTGGYHLYYPQDERLEENFGNKHNLGQNVDVKNWRGCIVAPPSVYPGCKNRCGECFKCKVRGKKYRWLVRPRKPKPMPEIVVQLILGERKVENGFLVKSAPFPKPDRSARRNTPEGGDGVIDNEILEQADQYLGIIDNSEREVWKKVGIAIRTIDPGKEGFRAWDNWSCDSDAYDEASQVSQWDSFHPYTQGRKAVDSLKFIRTLAFEADPEATETVDDEIRNDGDGCGYLKFEMPRMLKAMPEIKIKEVVVDDDIDYPVTSDAVRGILPILNGNWAFATQGVTNFGLMECFDHLYGDDVVLICSGKGYINILWNGETKLWEKVSVEAVEYKITRKLSRALCDTLIYYTQLFGCARSQEDRKSIEKKQGKLRCAYEYILSGSKASHPIVKLLRGKHRGKDAEFLDKLDQKRDLLSVKNGVVNLRTGALRDRRRDDYLSFCAPTRFVPSVDTSKSHKFLMDLCLDDKAKKEWLHKWCGYIITGEMSEEIFMLLVGVAHTGKDTLQDRITYTLGKANYVFNASIGTFLDKEGSSLPALSQIAQMEGKRVIFTSEPGSNTKFKGELLKTFTGQTHVCGKMYHKDPRSFLPQGKIMIACNDKPDLQATSAVKRRAVEFRLEAQFRDIGDCKDPFDEENPFHRKRDPFLKDSFQTKEACEEWLAFCVEGAKAWYQNPDLKKNLPSDVLDSTEAYFEENKDFIMEFVKEHLTIHRNVGSDKTKTMNRSLVYKRYMAWLDIQEDVGEFVPRKASAFYKQLTTKSGIRAKKVMGRRVLEVSFKISQTEWEGKVDAYRKEKGFISYDV